MAPFRNPFGKKPPVPNGVADENLEPRASDGTETRSQRSGYADSRASSSLSIKARKEETSEYKLSGTFFASRSHSYVPSQNVDFY